MTMEPCDIVIKESCVFCAQESGIDKIIPGMVIDDFLFDPCGYSMNGVGKDVSKLLQQVCLLNKLSAFFSKNKFNVGWRFFISFGRYIVFL